MPAAVIILYQDASVKATPHNSRPFKIVRCCSKSTDGEGQLAHGGNLAVHGGNRLAEAHRTAACSQLTFELQHVTGNNLPLEAGVLDTAEQHDLALVLLLGENGDCTFFR